MKAAYNNVHYELQNFTIIMRDKNETFQVIPFRFTDLNDNNIDLCIKKEGILLKKLV